MIQRLAFIVASFFCGIRISYGCEVSTPYYYQIQFEEINPVMMTLPYVARVKIISEKVLASNYPSLYYEIEIIEVIKGEANVFPSQVALEVAGSHCGVADLALPNSFGFIAGKVSDGVFFPMYRQSHYW